MKITRHSTKLLLTACIVFVATAPAAYGQQCASSFAGGGNYATASQPRAVAIGDFNGDGKADLAVANSGGIGNVSVLLGNGNGTFQASVGYGAGNGPFSVAVGDLNGDGRLDLAVANLNSNDVTVLLGNGDGTFAAAVNYAAHTNSSSVAIGDLNGDGKADLAVANAGSNDVSVLLGNGDGTFQARVNYNAGTSPYGVTIGDLNVDGRPDLVVANNGSSNVSVLAGNGNGTFQAQSQHTTDASPYFAAIGDLNNDGKPDLAVACSNSNNNVSVLLNTTNGSFVTFAASVNYFAGPAPAFVAIGDLNGDGRPDLVTANSGANYLSVLLGNGTGTFQSPNFYGAGATGTHPFCVAIGDFNGDGRPDLVASNYNSNYISVLLNISSMIGISPQPVSQSVTQGQTAVFTVTALGGGPLSYHWRRNCAPLYNVGHVSGAFTNTLTISNASAADIGAYDVQVSGGCNYAAVATSNSAALSVCAPAVCKGDFNNDNQFNSADIQGIVDALLAGQTCP